MSIDSVGRAWLEVDCDALRRNYRRLARRLGPGCRLLPMVKADAYGLGAGRVAAALAPEEPWGLGVATAREGAGLRRRGWDGRLVVFSPCPPVDGETLVTEDLEAAVNSLSGLRELAAAAGRGGTELRCHLNVDTGMGRFGLDAARAEEWTPAVRRVLEEAPLRLVSTFTHYHSAGTDAAGTERQREAFGSALAAMERSGLDPGLRHAANSAAAARWPDRPADVVRPGIFLYGGGAPDGELRAEAVVRLRARVLEVRRVSAGTTVSYGASYRTDRSARLATVGVGYGDGLRRTLSNRGEAIIDGARVPIRGRVCMDITVVDVTDRPEVRAGDVATLLGHDGESEIRLEELASTCDTIAHEILTGFTERLPRVPSRPGAGEPGARPADDGRERSA